MGRRPVIQEEYSRELTEVIHKRLEPKGVAVYIVGIHNCMAARGVKQRIPTITSKLTGPFKDDGKTRAEFYAIARGKR